MAASHSPLKDPEYFNWVKVGRAIQLSKKGIEKLVQNAIDRYHGTLLASLPHHLGTWKSHLEKAHRSLDKRRICWVNTDSSKWFTAGESWEIAKVFMAPLGSRKGDVTNAGTSDLSGLLNILEWCPRGSGGVFRTGVNIPLIADARGARNVWAHAPNLHLTDPETGDAFKFLELLLRDPELFSDKDVQLAVNELTRLSSTSLTVVEKNDLDILLQFKNEIGQDIASLESKVTEWREQAGAEMDEIQEQVRTFNELAKKHDEILELVGIIDYRMNRRVDDVENRLSTYVQSNNSRVGELEAKVNLPTTFPFASHPVISFNPVCDRMQEPFVGREWLFSKVDEWLNKSLKPKESRTFIIWGGPGTGKTAWVREMIARGRKPAAYHFCQSDNPVTSYLPSLTENLSTMLAESIPEYANYTRQPSFNQLVGNFKDDPEKQFDCVITTPLQQLQVSGTQYILVDGLDEGGPAIASCFAKLCTKLPSCFRVILTSRHGAAALSNLFTNSCDVSLDEFKVNDVSVHNYLEEDIRAFVIQKFIKLKSEHDTLPPFFARDEKSAIEEILQASKQCFLYAKLVIEDIFDAKIEIRLPASLYELYYLEFRRLYPDTDYYERNVAPIIEIVLALRELDVTMHEDARKSNIGKLAAMVEFLSLNESWNEVECLGFGELHKEYELMSRVAESPLMPEIGKRIFGKILKSLSAYLISREGIKYYFSHSSIVEFLQNDSNDYFCDVTNGHRIMAKFYLNLLKNERLQSKSRSQESDDSGDSSSEFYSEESDENFVYLFKDLIFRYFYHSSHLPSSEGNCVKVLTDELDLEVITLLRFLIHWGGNRVLILNLLLSKTDILHRLALEAKSTVLEGAIRVGCKDVTAKVIESGYWLFNRDVRLQLLGFLLLNRKSERSGKSVLQQIAPGETGTDGTFVDFFIACTKKKGSFPNLLFLFMCDESGLMQHYLQHFFVSGDNPDVAVPYFSRNTLQLDESTSWNKDVEKYFGKLKSQKKTVINLESLKENPDFLDLDKFTYHVIEQPLPKIEGMIKKGEIFVSFIYGWHVLLRRRGDESLPYIEFLMKNGASVNAIGEFGETGLMIATKYGYVKMAELLLRSGANVNQRDFRGSTALHYAVDKYKQERTDSGRNAYETSSVIFMLVQHQADPYVKNSLGFTAIDLARISRNPFHYDLLTGEIH